MIPMWLMHEPETRQTMPEPVSAGAGRSSGLMRTTVKMAMPNVLIGFGAAILIPYMNVFFKEQFVISDKLLGTMFSLSSLMIGVGSLIGPRLALRLGGKVRAVTLTQFSSLVFLMLIGFSPFYWLAAIGFLMRTMLMNMATPLYSAFCMDQVPERDQSVVNSVLNISWQVGWSVGRIFRAWYRKITVLHRCSWQRAVVLDCDSYHVDILPKSGEDLVSDTSLESLWTN